MTKNKLLLTLTLRFSLVSVLWLLVTLPWFLVTPAYAGWYSGGAGAYQYRKLITIDKTKVSGSGTLPNFPLLISSTDTDLKTTGNGGKVTDADGDDIIFTSSDGTTKLDHEKEKYTASTGEYIGWVKLPSISPTNNTTLYIYYGNSSISTSQENATGVWDTNFKGVWHMHNASSPATDSTTNANNGTQSGGVTFGATGQINSATSYDGTNDYLNLGETAIVSNTSVFSLSAWTKVSALPLIYTEQSSVNGWVTLQFLFYGNVDLAVHDGSTWYECIGNTTISDGNWHSVVATFSTSAGMNLYLDGNLDKSCPSSNHTQASSKKPTIRAYYTGDSTPAAYGSGPIDEVRVSNIARSADWIATEYNNQSSPAAFYGLGGAEAQGWAAGTAAAKVKGGGGGSAGIIKFRGGAKIY